MEDFDRPSNVVGWFLLGSVAGVAVALLTAPRRGSETRATLARGARSAREKASVIGGRVAAGVRELRGALGRSGNGAAEATDFEFAPEDVEFATEARAARSHA